MLFLAGVVVGMLLSAGVLALGAIIRAPGRGRREVMR